MNISTLIVLVIVIVIAALVIYATVGRIVQEQRKLIGTTKALGFFTREILAKYMIFGVSSTLFGSLLGIILAYFMVETIVLKAYGVAYVIGTINPVVQPFTTLLVVLAAALLAAAAVYLACRRLMKATAISLMQEQMPKGRQGSKKTQGSKAEKGLYNRLILRNIRSDIPRVAVTIVSVAGCCALLVIGFTLRGAVADAINRQYGEKRQALYSYRLVFDFKTDAGILSYLNGKSFQVQSVDFAEKYFPGYTIPGNEKSITHD